MNEIGILIDVQNQHRKTRTLNDEIFSKMLEECSGGEPLLQYLKSVICDLKGQINYLTERVNQLELIEVERRVELRRRNEGGIRHDY